MNGLPLWNSLRESACDPAKPRTGETPPLAESVRLAEILQVLNEVFDELTVAEAACPSEAA
jgi:hypothetical protein